MKTITAAMRAHLQSEVTTLCTCWKIIRKDGVTLGFTSHDEDLTIDGIVFESASGFDATAISSTADFSVDNLDVAGILDSDRITTEDIRNRLFDMADVYVFQVNYNDLTMGIIPLRRGWFGEATMTPNGQYTIELRGMMQALLHENVEIFTPECRADFCDARCKLNILDFQRTCTVTALGSDRYSFVASNIPDAPDLPTSVGAHKNWRLVVETTGNTQVVEVSEIRLWDQNGDVITGGTPSAYNYDEDHNPSAARDGDSDTSWRFSNKDEDDNPLPINGTWFGLVFSSVKDVKYVSIRAALDKTKAPTAFRLEYTDAVNPFALDTVWTLAKSCTTSWTSSYQEAVWGINSATGEPINKTTSPVAIPPPLTGASTYIGGVVKFLSGDNAGMALEVVDFNSATRTVTMFDAPYYPIKVGDVFKISQGCQKTPDACKTYGNYINYRGEPDVPGQDEYLWYPDAKS